MTLSQQIIQLLPYEKPFLFVDEISRMDANGCEGFYTFREDEFFYEGHFKNYPVTPGVILTECMAQIGVVALGIFFVQSSRLKVQSSTVPSSEFRVSGSRGFALSESQVLFEKPVFPKEKVRVVSEKMYWRLGKLKCKVEMYNVENERVCKGTISGVMETKPPKSPKGGL